MGRRYDSVSFLSDWGLVDECVGVVKSVIRDLAAHVTVTDLTHQIEMFDVRAGSLALARSISYLPSGVVLAVVDPGVGSDRKAVAIEVADGEGVLVGPDNGLLAPAVAMAGGAGRTVVLTNLDFQFAAPGATFAGRDIFAPATAHLCNGVDLYELGDAIDPDALLPGIVPLPRFEDEAILADVLWVDRFGNCQLNLGPDEIDGWGDKLRVLVGEDVRIATVGTTYSGLAPGVIGVVPDSCGMLALVLDRRSAAAELGLGPSDQVVLRRLEGADGAAGLPGASTPIALRASRPAR